MTWKTMAALGFSSYEASDRGQVRSIDRTDERGRQLRGRVIATRVSNRGYVLIDLTDDSGVRVTRTVHTLVLGTFVGLCPDGQQGRHLNDDPLDNRWPENLAWGTAKENNADKVRNGNRAPSPPPKQCLRCSQPFAGNGKRCHDCVVAIGVEAGQLLSRGVTLTEAMAQLEYPSAEGLHKLAVKYGGYGLLRAGSDGSWLRRVVATVRDWLQAGDAA